MKVVFLPQKREQEIAGEHRVGDLLRKLNLLPGTVLVIRNDELLTSEDTVADSDTIEIRNVISGG
jgi:sulfur carrier protein ThiS